MRTTKRGYVGFYENSASKNIPVCVDIGKKLYVNKLDDKTILLALRLAEKKWGGASVSGSSEYIKRCQELGIKYGISVTVRQPLQRDTNAAIATTKKVLDAAPPNYLLSARRKIAEGKPLLFIEREAIANAERKKQKHLENEELSSITGTKKEKEWQPLPPPPEAALPTDADGLKTSEPKKPDTEPTREPARPDRQTLSSDWLGKVGDAVRFVPPCDSGLRPLEGFLKNYDKENRMVSLIVDDGITKRIIKISIDKGEFENIAHQMPHPHQKKIQQYLDRKKQEEREEHTRNKAASCGR